MAYCNNCGCQLLDTDKFCPGCGSKTIINQYESKNKDIKNKENLDKINIGIILVQDVIGGIFWGVIFLLTICLTFIGVGLTLLFHSNISSMIGGLFVIIIGGILSKIPYFFIDRIKNENIKTTSVALAVIGGLILAVYIWPSYITKFSIYY